MDTGKYILYAEAPGGSTVSTTWGQPETERTAGTEWLVSHTIAWGRNSCTVFAVVPTGDHIDLACGINLKEELTRFPDSWWWRKRRERQELLTIGSKIKRKGIKSDSTAFDLGGEGDA